MESLFYYNQILVSRVSLDFKRALYEVVNWNQRMIAISGARGVGKTTLMLQRQKETAAPSNRSLYVSMEHPYFYNHSLFDLADKFYRSGGRFLFADEVHKYANWSRELKVIYDLFPELNIVFSASSALDIYRGEADLSRRVATYLLPGMSFREFLTMKKLWSEKAISLEDILDSHLRISADVIAREDLLILPLFKEYLKNGYYPFMSNLTPDEYAIRLNQVINTILDTDMAYSSGYTPSTALKLKKLLGILAESVPFQPNVAELARKLNISRDTIYHYLKYLEKALLITSLHARGKGMSLLQKPEKLYLENTNLSYALSMEPDKGSLRETFMLNQLINSKQEVGYPKEGDFSVGECIFEIGGGQKKRKQIATAEKGYVVADDILTGTGNKIPLWLFGFLY